MPKPALAMLCLLAFLPATAWAQGSPLGPEFRVNTYTTNYQATPAVAADASGNFGVVWSGGDSASTQMDVLAQRFTGSGSPLGPEFRVNTYTTGVQFEAQVASDSSGNFVVVWQSRALPPQPPPSPVFVFGQRYASSGAPLGPEFRVNTLTTLSQIAPAVASDSAGNFVVVFDRTDGSYSGIFGQRYASSGATLGTEFRVNTFTSNSQAAPSVASDAAGNFVVVWQSRDQDGDFEGIFGQRFADTGAPLGPEFRVNTFWSNYQRGPSVAVAGSGGFVVVWNSRDQDGSDEGVFAQRYASSGAPLGPEFRVNTHTDYHQRDASVVADSAGNFVVVWSSMYQKGPFPLNYGVFGQRYASAGAPSGPEFLVNTYTVGNQYAADVAADPAGNFVVVWASFYGLPDVDIFGQRYGQIVPVELMRFHVD